ncbi:MAG: iron-sulfur cluster-binding domain-containing protein, partial [Arenicella sp.]|nr:iron-sulfur cluster-binding domain-containing protein [Arenicella sp.]
NKIRITVKRDKGAGSQAIHRWNIQDKITISGPFGDATLKGTSNAIHFISAGIGITPTVAKLHALAQDQPNTSIQITHVARSRSELALWSDVIELSKKLPHVILNLHLTANASFEKGCLAGRPDPRMIAKTAKSANADVHICGPTAFINEMTKALAEVKVTHEKIYIDRFNSSDVKTEMRPISKTGPTKVTFTRSGITDYWYPEDGTLLDFAEARGAIIQSHCRAGLCKTCLCKILNGVATRLVGLEGDDEIQTLLCSSIPSQDLTLDM